ncbi:hypothetical protein HMI54_011270 [Coelomomyces lativittatus]|nr:hypothetical protein HMI56_004522 [Coelomomyces lativittatus]KAJ1515930.1 hypothetical protein HMI55_003218 [Coelomomyces lativittatus]KAJ1515964.1 hypothetical protein HMI54_011270 [Coelomomyces lativittatus]
MMLHSLKVRSTLCGGVMPFVRLYASKVLKIENNQFEKEVLQSKVPVLVDFYADWCGPCKVLSPRLEELAQLKKSQLHIVKLDGEVNYELASQFKISAYPTVVLFKEGKEIDRFIGVRELKNIIAFLDKHTPVNKP